MSMQRITLVAALLAAGAALGYVFAQWRGASHDAPAAAASAPAERKILYWHDPMVPGQKFDKPGKSPFMDMELVPRYADEAAAEDGASLAVSTQARQALGLRLATVERRRVGATVDAPATVQFNERDIAIVQARAAGFVERVAPRAPGDVIGAGAPLAELMMPEWLAAQQEFLAVKATGDAALARAARQRLLLLGMSEAQVERVDGSGRTEALQAIVAPIGGVIVELAVRPGMTVAPGMTLARINGLSSVWLEAAVPEALAAAVRPGAAVQARFAAWPGEVWNGRVAALLPEANRDARTLRVRVELPNRDGRLQSGLSAQVRLEGARRDTLVVPAEAVIRTGRRAIVYLAQQEGRFSPVEVEIGEQVGDLLVVRSGLEAGQQVVASGQFLLDSEASLQGVLARDAAAPASAAPAAAEAQPGHAGHEGHGAALPASGARP